MENFNYWADLGVVKLHIWAGLTSKPKWATEFFIEMSGFEFFEKRSVAERLEWVETEVYKHAKFTQKLIEDGVDFYRFKVTAQIGEQSEVVEYEILKTTYHRLFPWQQHALAQIYGTSLIEWDFERVEK